MQAELTQTLTLDLLHMVFSAFGFVQKMALLPRADAAAMTVWAQFADTPTAVQARAVLRRPAARRPGGLLG